MGKEIVTIKDVAAAAGVSKGTVDRVIHNRGEVSKESREKVLQVIKDLGYTPNMHASMLASKKTRKFVCLIPESKTGELWDLTEQELLKGSRRIERLNIETSIVKYDQFSTESFTEACRKVLAQAPSGVILAPIFQDETQDFVKTLQEKSIPYIYINSKLKSDKEENSGYFAYFGMPRYLSGYLCADLLTLGMKTDRVCIIRIIRDKFGHSDPTMRRREGFIAYFNEHFPDTVIDNVFVNPHSQDDINDKLESYLNEHPETRHFVMLNSRVYLVADFISRHKGQLRVVGFDTLPKNITALKDDLIQVIIAQRIATEAKDAIRCLTDYTMFNKFPEKRDNYTSMDILTKYNCDYY